jgi:hypothetical protein
MFQMLSVCQFSFWFVWFGVLGTRRYSHFWAMMSNLFFGVSHFFRILFADFSQPCHPLTIQLLAFWSVEKNLMLLQHLSFFQMENNFFSFWWIKDASFFLLWAKFALVTTKPTLMFFLFCFLFCLSFLKITFCMVVDIECKKKRNNEF